MIEDLVYKYGKTEDEVCSALAISKFNLRRSIRTLAFIKQYKNSDYGDQFQTPMYSIFEAAVGNPAMKQWLGWNDSDYITHNTVNERVNCYSKAHTIDDVMKKELIFKIYH